MPKVFGFNSLKFLNSFKENNFCLILLLFSCISFFCSLFLFSKIWDFSESFIRKINQVPYKNLLLPIILLRQRDQRKAEVKRPSSQFTIRGCSYITQNYLVLALVSFSVFWTCVNLD